MMLAPCIVLPVVLMALGLVAAVIKWIVEHPVTGILLGSIVVALIVVIRRRRAAKR